MSAGSEQLEAPAAPGVLAGDGLRATQELFERILATISDPVFVKDDRHRRVLVNEAYCDAVGRTREELIGRSDHELYPASLAREFVAQDDRVLAAGVEEQNEVTLVNARGERRRLSVRKSPYVGPDGRRYVLGIIRDVTESREAQDEVRTKAKLLDSATDGILLVAPDASLVYFNQAMTRMTGYGPAELSRLRLVDIEPPEFAERVAGNMARIHREGAAIFESAYLRKDGSVLPVEVHARPTEVGGRPLILSLVRDISERKRLERLLLQAKGEWEETFNIISEAITVHDLDFNIVRSNRAARELFELPGGLERPKCYRVYHGADAPPAGCPSCRVLQTGAPAAIEVFEPHLGKHLEIRALPRNDAEGRLTGIVHVVRDVTARKRAEEEQRALEQQLVQAQKLESIGRLAGGVAHDFNNVLSAILGYSELGLFRTDQGHPLREPFQVIHESGQRATALVRQLLAFSRRQVLETRVVDLHELLERFVGLLRRMIRENVCLELRLGATRATVLADPHQIEQVVMNLAVNARDALPRGGSITIETGDLADGAGIQGLEPGPHVVLAVRDDGSGIPAQMLGRIFEPFFTTKELGRGTGLGLATVYGIVRQHRGVTTVESQVGRGSTFRVFLPLAARESAPDAPGPARLPLPRGAETVLVVDDDPAVRGLAVEVLRPLGYRVLDAGGGEEGLRIAAGFEGRIDVLLTDVVMPGMDGRTLAEALRRERPEVRTILMTGYADELVADAAVLAQNDSYLPKPVTPSSLAGVLRAVLDRRR